jgi:periplasmic protein TonB
MLMCSINDRKFLYCHMKISLIICLSLCAIAVSAQDKNQFYALDAKMNQTVLDSSKYILWIHEKDSIHWQWDYYFSWGPLVKSTTYSDHDGTVLNGRFCIYNNFGNLDSTGVYENGKKNGLFLKLGSLSKDSIEILRQYVYEHDSLTGFKNLTAEKRNFNELDSTGSGEPGFPGGNSAWDSYLTHNLRYPDRAMNKMIQGKVVICFLVNSEGYMNDPFIEKSVEYSLDQEAIRLIKNSGKWIPVQKDGTPIASFKKQPVAFRLERQ